MKKLKPTQLISPPSLSQLKSQKKSPLTPTTKKKPLKQSPSSTKSKQQQIKKSQQPQDYIIINDSIYSANTFTERNNYEQFLHKVKKQKQIQRKSFLVKSQVNEGDSILKKSRQNARKDKMWKKLSPQDFIQTMTLQEKKQMFFKLQDQIRSVNNLKSTKLEQFPTESLHLTKYSQPCSTESFENQLSERQRIDSERQRKEKFSLIEQKLENLKMQLMFKWQGQMDRLEEMCRKGKLTDKQKQTKSSIVQKLKDHKLKILDCTKTLFEKILKEEEYEQEHSEQKANKIEAILQSLHSFPSLQSMDDQYQQKEPNIDHLKVKSPEKNLPQFSPHKNLNIDSSPLQIVEDNSHQAFLDQFRESSWDRNPSTSKSSEELKSPLNFLNSSPNKVRYAQVEEGLNFSQQHKELNILVTNSYNQQQTYFKQSFSESKPLFGDMNEKISLKLDLRLDEVVFGQDQYPQCQKQNEPKSQENENEYEEKNQPQNEQTQNNVEPISPSSLQQSLKIKDPHLSHEESSQANDEEQKPNKSQIVNGNTSPVSPPKVQKISMSKISFSSQSSQQILDELACKQQPLEKMSINIPQILSRQKMQTLAFEQNRAFRQNFDKHIAFQMGCIEPQSSDPSVPLPFHFTTLVDINSYVVGFYEFMMKKYMASLVDNLNVPYGKSAIDKLYSLQTEGFVIEESYNDMNNILSENHFVEYQREVVFKLGQIMFTMRKCTEYETAHNRAVFEAFTKCINVYRPYFDLEGEVYPWIVSEKGITFYEITDDNIEEVFEKSKIKVLQYCTALCGLHPPAEIKNDDQSALMNQKNEQNLTKMIKTEVLQQFEEWKIRFVNFQCLVRMLVADRIYREILNEVVGELSQIEGSKAEI